MYKYDMHVHTSETSPCGNILAEDIVRLYYEAGYNGICITDHYTEGYFSGLEGSWNKKVETFLTGYHNAVFASKNIDFQVVLGMELRLASSSNEYLIYGITEDFLYLNPELYKLDLHSFSSLVKKEGFLMYQAHPFRKGMTPAEPSLLHGIEVYNGNPRHNSRNDEAYDFAVKNGLNMISGSDCHEICDVARGGIIIKNQISAYDELIRIIKNNDFELIKTI